MTLLIVEDSKQVTEHYKNIEYHDNDTPEHFFIQKLKGTKKDLVTSGGEFVLYHKQQKKEEYICKFKKNSIFQTLIIPKYMNTLLKKEYQANKYIYSIYDTSEEFPVFNDNGNIVILHNKFSGITYISMSIAISIDDNLLQKEHVEDIYVRLLHSDIGLTQCTQQELNQYSQMQDISVDGTRFWRKKILSLDYRKIIEYEKNNPY